MMDKASTGIPTSSPLRTSSLRNSGSEKNPGGSSFFASPLVHSHSANTPPLQTSSSGTLYSVEGPAESPAQAQQEHSDNLSDAEDDGATSKENKKGKFQTLRKSFRVMVNHRQRLDSATTAVVHPSTPPSVAQAPKDDFAECHTFAYTQCEEAVISSQRTILCPKSQSNITLDAIVPELTMIDLVKYLVKFSDLEIMDKIATGGFGAVFKGKLNGSMVAVKQLIEDAHEDAMAAYREFWREVFMSSILMHKCIVSLKAFSMSPCCMVMEFMPHGDLYSYLHSSRNDLTWQSKLRMAINIADAMAFLHGQKPKICHRDLKSPNILMADKSDPEILCKISDFGESRLVATSGQGRQNLANPLWLAPEVMRGGEYTEKCDVYSFGIIMWELITAADPFDEYPVALSGFMSRLEDEIIVGLRPTIPMTCNSEYRTLIEAAWDNNPDQRPTFAALHTSLLGIKNSKFNTIRK